MIVFVIWYRLDSHVKGLPKARHRTLAISDESFNLVTYFGDNLLLLENGIGKLARS